MDLFRSVSSKHRKARGSNILPTSQENARSQSARMSEPSGSRPTTVEPGSSGSEARSWPRRFGDMFQSEELATATNNFSEEFLIEKCRFWNAYQVKLEDPAKPAVVKRLKFHGPEGKTKFVSDIISLPRMEHPNVVKMLGYTVTTEWGLVVYEFMPRGSLKNNLHDVAPDKEPLDWMTRMKIGSDVAKGLMYLHELEPNYVIHGDLNSSNVMLDEEFHAKICDAGLAKCLPEEYWSPDSVNMFTKQYGYFPPAPEIKSYGSLSVEFDVYSFGVLLLELITGRPRFRPWKFSNSEEIPLSVNSVLRTRSLHLLKDPESITELADPRLKGEFPLSSLRRALELASNCVERYAGDRPSIKQVVLDLDALVLQPHHPKASTESSTGVRISKKSGLLKFNSRKGGQF